MSDQQHHASQAVRGQADQAGERPDRFGRVAAAPAANQQDDCPPHDGSVEALGRNRMCEGP
jgi:hypothetical protein